MAESPRDACVNSIRNMVYTAFVNYRVPLDIMGNVSAPGRLPIRDNWTFLC